MTTTRNLLAAAALLAAAPLTHASPATNVARNAYVEIRATSPVRRNGGLDFTAPGADLPLEVVVQALPGWELKSPARQNLADGRGGGGRSGASSGRAGPPARSASP